VVGKGSEREAAAAGASRDDVDGGVDDFADRFIGVIGHDLRNPLSAISNSAELLRIGAGDPSKVGERILRSTLRLSRMVDQLVDVTRIRVGHGIQLTPSRVDLGAHLANVVESLRAVHPTADLRLEARGALEGSWDAERLGRMASTLIVNALEHGTPGQPVEIALDGGAAEVVLEVANRGAIAAEVLPRLFEPFRPGHKRGGKASGLGLGLFVARAIAAGHGGALELSSDEASGTLARVRLPRAS
jgi:signal transduction histidine kinase